VVILFSENEFSNLKISNLNGAHIFIVDEHQFVLPVWAYYSLSNNKKYSLVTFDFHTDTRQAFNSYAHKKRIKFKYRHNDREKFAKTHIKGINSKDLVTICQETKNLANDEHIRAAMYFGYIHNPNVITVEETHPGDDIKCYINEDSLGIVVGSKQTDDPYRGDFQLYRKFHLNRLDDDYIESAGFKIKNLNDQYTLDFDLDYFPTKESLQPNKNKIINQLISDAQFITIAREKKYFVENCKENNFSVLEAEDLLLKLIESVLSK